MTSFIKRQKHLFLKGHGYHCTRTRVSELFSFDVMPKHEAVAMVRAVLSMREPVAVRVAKRRPNITFFGIKVENEGFRLTHIVYSRQPQNKNGPISWKNVNRIIDGPRDAPLRPFSRSIPTRMRLLVFSRDNHQCQYCGWKNGIEGVQDRVLTLDHIVPISFGGTHTASNLRTCCLKCNLKKHYRILDETIREWIYDPNA